LIDWLVDGVGVGRWKLFSIIMYMFSFGEMAIVAVACGLSDVCPMLRQSRHVMSSSQMRFQDETDPSCEQSAGNLDCIRLTEQQQQHSSSSSVW
jgi:hypothetical protein